MGARPAAGGSQRLGAWTFFLSSFVTPLVGIVVLAPAIRRRRWSVVVAAMVLLAAAVFASLQGGFGLASAVLRALAVGLLAGASGYLYQRFFMGRDRAGP